MDILASVGWFQDVCQCWLHCGASAGISQWPAMARLSNSGRSAPPASSTFDFSPYVACTAGGERSRDIKKKEMTLGLLVELGTGERRAAQPASALPAQ